MGNNSNHISMLLRVWILFYSYEKQQNSLPWAHWPLTADSRRSRHLPSSTIEKLYSEAISCFRNYSGCLTCSGRSCCRWSGYQASPIHKVWIHRVCGISVQLVTLRHHFCGHSLPGLCCCAKGSRWPKYSFLGQLLWQLAPLFNSASSNGCHFSSLHLASVSSRLHLAEPCCRKCPLGGKSGWLWWHQRGPALSEDTLGFKRCKRCQFCVFALSTLWCLRWTTVAQTGWLAAWLTAGFVSKSNFLDYYHSRPVTFNTPQWPWSNSRVGKTSPGETT